MFKGRRKDRAPPLTRGVISEEERKAMGTENKDWIEARKKYHLTDTHIQMAKELGMNPKKFGSLANHKQEKWKAPLPEFIEELYLKRFRREKPETKTRTL